MTDAQFFLTLVVRVLLRAAFADAITASRARRAPAAWCQHPAHKHLRHLGTLQAP